MRRDASLIALLLALGAAGCAITPNSDVNAFARSSGSNSFEVLDRRFDSPTALVLPVVHDQQTEGPSCGAHVLASVVNYWRGPDTIRGDAIYRETPPADALGYSMAEIIGLARDQGLMASGVRLAETDLIRELEAGRPVLVPVRVPSVYVQQRQLPGGDVPVLGLIRNTLIYRTGLLSELTSLAMVNHYMLVVGYENDDFVVVEPVMGYRTISFDRLERYRRPFANAAIVFSAPSRPTAAAASSQP